MKAPIRLKKYGNRRIYDARRSGYVTLDEIRQMLQAGEEVEVVDAKSGEDLTRAVLVQIILEAEGPREALPTAFLTEVIRLGEGPLRERFTRGLTGFLHTFWDVQQATQRTLLDAQREWQQSLQHSFQQTLAQATPPWGLPSAPFSFFANPLAALGGPPPRPTAPDEPRLPAARVEPARLEPTVDPDEFARLKAQLGETQGLLRELLAQRQADPPAPPRPAPTKTAARGSTRKKARESRPTGR